MSVVPSEYDLARRPSDAALRIIGSAHVLTSEFVTKLLIIQIERLSSEPCLHLPKLLPESDATASTMSSSTAISPIPNFQLIFNTSLKAYERRTKTDILAHPLASQLQACKSPGSILNVLQGQVDDLAQARRNDETLTKWLSPTINVLLAFSAFVGEGVSLVRLNATFS